jgi:hypothetical protein
MILGAHGTVWQVSFLAGRPPHAGLIVFPGGGEIGLYRPRPAAALSLSNCAATGLGALAPRS